MFQSINKPIVIKFHSSLLDEVVSDFNDSFFFAHQLMETHRLSYKAVAKILQCYTLTEINLSIEDRLTNLVFESSESWQSIRNLAKEALIEMGEFDWRTKVKSKLTWTEI